MADKTLPLPAGFRFAAVKAGIKTSGAYDLGLIVADRPGPAAAVFTQNKIVGPAVIISRDHIRSGRTQAVFVNAGNANTCTGSRGHRDGITICKRVAQHLDLNPNNVLVCSTGVIGHYLPMGKVRSGIDHAVECLSRSAKSATQFARAIMTTDTKVKIAHKTIRLGSTPVRIVGTAKGSGMIAPNMATMLAFITTDADISSAMLKKAFRPAVKNSFNKVSIDNHTSTSDSAIVMASGCANHPQINRSGKHFLEFSLALTDVCDRLAKMIAADGEGASCMITVAVSGARSKRDATLAVRAITDSPLVRCACNGADPNWGRIISAIGYSGARFDPEKLTCRIAGTEVFKSQQPCRFNARTLSQKMKSPQWNIHVDLGIGPFEDFCYTCDLSKKYVAINADYHT